MKKLCLSEGDLHKIAQLASPENCLQFTLFNSSFSVSSVPQNKLHAPRDQNKLPAIAFNKEI